MGKFIFTCSNFIEIESTAKNRGWKIMEASRTDIFLKQQGQKDRGETRNLIRKYDSFKN